MIRDLSRTLLGLWPFVARWSLVLAEFVTVQVIVQGVGFIAGFLIVRTLDKQDYALYTLANTGVTALASLANGGVVNATAAIAGRGWQDRHHLGQVIAGAIRVRGFLMMLTAVPTAAVIGWLLVQNGGEAVNVALLLLAICGTAYWQLSASIMSTVLRLQGHIRRIQTIDLAGSLLRTALVIALFVFLNAFLAVVTALAAAGLAYFLSRRWVAQDVDLTANVDPVIQGQFYAIVRRQWFSDLYWIFQGQVSIFLLGFFGGSDAVANFGALGRLAALFGIFSAVMASIVLPRYARCQDPTRMRTLYFSILLGFTAVVMAPALLAVWIPDTLLWVLGNKYQGLSQDLVLVMLNAGFSSIYGTAWVLNTMRGWIIPSWINISMWFCTQAGLMWLIGVSTLEQVLLIGIIASAGIALVHVYATFVFSRGFTRCR